MIYHGLTEKIICDLAQVEEFPHDRIDSRKFIVSLTDSGDVQGFVSYVLSSFREPQKVGIGIVYVLPQYRKMGAATEMLTALFLVAGRRKINPGYYEEDGEKYLKKKIDGHNNSV